MHSHILQFHCPKSAKMWQAYYPKYPTGDWVWCSARQLWLTGNAGRCQCSGERQCVGPLEGKMRDWRDGWIGRWPATAFRQSYRFQVCQRCPVVSLRTALMEAGIAPISMLWSRDNFMSCQVFLFEMSPRSWNGHPLSFCFLTSLVL